jgi:hypothetical protein
MFEIDKRIPWPELRLKLIARDQFSGPAQQHFEDCERLTLQADAHSFLAQFP